MKLNRKTKLFLNTITGIIKQFVSMICGFILPRYILLYYGSAINGLVASITNFLGFISLLDMGVGAVIQSNLYKPLAQKNNDEISKIIKSSEKFFRKLSYIFLCYIMVLSIIYPKFIDKKFDALFSISLLLIIAISTFAQYFFGMTYQLLLNADQRSYVPQTLSIITIFLNTIFSVILMKIGMSIHIVKLFTSIIYILRPLGQVLYVRKKYLIDKKITLNGEPIKQKWNGFSQHLASVVCQNIDIAVLSLFSNLENVSVYSVYYLVTNGVEQIILTAANGLEALFGNMIANKEKEKLNKVFSAIEWVIHTSVTIIFTIAAILITPFVSVYTKEVNDTNYIFPIFGYLLVIAYGCLCLRIPYFRIIKAAGHFKQTQNGAYISAILNVIITISLVFTYGLNGVAIGTLVAMLYHTLYFVWYLRKNILNRSLKFFLIYIITDFLVGMLSFIFTKNLSLDVVSYLGWTILAIKVSFIVVLISLITNIIFYRNQIKNFSGLIFRR